MKADRVVIQKVLYPKPMIEVNIEFDQKDGTVDVVTDYSDKRNMNMRIDGEMIIIFFQSRGISFQRSYKLFRDNKRNPFRNRQDVEEYMMFNDNVGYSADKTAKIPPGVTLF